MSDVDFPSCGVCGVEAWAPAYAGPVRDGAPGRSRLAEVRRCTVCGVHRLAESACLKAESYETADYRLMLGQDADARKHFAAHDELARFTIDTLWPREARGRVVADIGCAAGGLLDHFSGLAAEVVAVEPARFYAQGLVDRGFVWHPSASAAAATHAGRVDIAFCIQVIEHVDQPRALLEDIERLLAPGGVAIISTPNRADILMDLLPDDFPAFFYRTQHRWAFAMDDLAECARRAGLETLERRFVHRYGFSNAASWLRDRAPAGRRRLPPIDSTMDGLWGTWLESTGRADNLYLVARRAVR